MRLAVSRAPSTSGGSAASIRRHVLALVMMPESGWLTSWAIEAVNALSVVTRATWASSERALSSASSATLLSVTSWRAPTNSGSTRNVLDDMGDAAHVLHGASGGHDPERESRRSSPVMPRAITDSNDGRSSG